MGAVVLRHVSSRVRELLARSAKARRRARTCEDAGSREFWLTMEAQWLCRAANEMDIVPPATDSKTRAEIAGIAGLEIALAPEASGEEAVNLVPDVEPA